MKRPKIIVKITLQSHYVVSFIDQPWLEIEDSLNRREIRRRATQASSWSVDSQLPNPIDNGTMCVACVKTLLDGGVLAARR